MNLFLIKFLSLFIYPLTVGVGLFLIGIVFLYLNKKRTALVLFCATLFLLWIFSSPIVAGYLVVNLERLYLPVKCEDSPSADAIVILGGAVGVVAFPRKYPDLCSSSDRIYHAANLFKAKKAPFIIASGGTIPWVSNIPESTPMVELLRDWGVPEEAILLESGSTNSYENALYTKRLMEEKGFKNVLLVTSALHMRRALATFKKAGLEAIPSPTDYVIADEGGKTTLLDFLPDVGALNGATHAIKEYVGYIVYRWWGWI